MTPKQTLFSLSVMAVFAALLTGCGGGGGTTNGGSTGGNDSGRVVIGRVVDMNGNPVPGAVVRVQGGGPQATTLSQGGYRLVGVNDGVQRLTASVSQNGTTDTGSTQALVLSGNDTALSNVNIQLSPSSQQASITGNVHDPSGHPLRDARVFLGVFVTPNSQAAPGSVASLVAIADDNGNYQLQNVPAPATQYTMTASLQGYQNAKTVVQSLQTGETRPQDFTLTNSSNQSVLVPTNVAVFSFTQPSIGQQPYAVAQSSGVASVGAVYEKIRRAVSSAYAHPAAHSQKLHPHAASSFGSYAVEMDLFFDNNQPNSLAGFRVYNSSGTDSPTPYDFLQDPLADFYTDLDPYYVADQQYNFAVSAINTDGSETALSGTSSVQPLEQLTLTQPNDSSTVGSPVTVAWNGVNGASDYQVFLYTSGFPSVNAQYQQFDAHGGTGYVLPGLGSGDYYVVVAGATSDGSAVTLSPITKFHIP